MWNQKKTIKIKKNTFFVCVLKNFCIFALSNFKGLLGAVKQLASKFAYQLAKIRAQRYVGKNPRNRKKVYKLIFIRLFVVLITLKLNIMKTITEKYKGVNFFAYSIEEMQKIKDNFDFERSIFYRSSVYTYSCIARELEDNTIELIEYFNNGKDKKITNFDNKNSFWKSISKY